MKIIKKINYTYKKEKILNQVTLNLKKEEIDKLGITQIENKLVFSFKNNIIKVWKGEILADERKETNEKLIELIRNYSIKFNKAGKYMSYKLVIPIPVIVALNYPKEVELSFTKEQEMIVEVKKEGIKLKKAKVITMKINKGGTGKSFLTVQLGAGLASVGKKVLILTSDSQNNILDYTYSDLKRPEFDGGLKEFVKGREGEILKLRDNLFYIPLESPNFTKNFIRDFPIFLEKEKEKYDYILIDSTPTEKLDKVFVKCSDEIIIPCLATKVSVQGAINVVNEIQEIEKETNKKIKINSIVVNMFENIKEHKDYLEKLTNILENKDILFPVPIKKLSLIETLLGKGKTIWESEAKILQETQETMIEIIKNI